MDFEIINGVPALVESQLLIVGISADGSLGSVAQQLDEASNGYLTEIINSGDIKGKAGDSLVLHKVPGVTAKRILLLGTGKADEKSDAATAKLISTAMANVKKLGVSDALFAFDFEQDDDAELYRDIRQIVEHGSASLYQYDLTKSEKAEESPLELLGILLDDERSEIGEGALVDGVSIANGVDTARYLGDLPANICTPSFLAEQAEDLAGEFEDLTTNILDEDEMEALGMGSLLSVTRGSTQPAKLIVMEYKGGDEGTAPHVLVGKGITFDTGGISLKPGAGMDEMKYDMCGAANVFGAMTAACEMELPINLVGIVAAAENMPAGNATKPGDVVTSMSGQTIEILNTDAEGRLVLCDALTYAERFNPASVIDIATLTGACIIALGHNMTGMMSNNDELAKELVEAGKFAADEVWRLPINDEYQEQLKSNFADMANIGGRPAGTITAACFLARFMKKQRWAHLDIAGTAWKSGSDKGATGRAVPLLSQYLLNQAALEMGDEEHDHDHEHGHDHG